MHGKSTALKVRAFLLLSLLFLFSTSSALAGVVYVDQHATGAQHGSSWKDAFTTITAGLTASASGNEVWVKSATYNESITMQEGVALYGGFPADGTPGFEQRDWVTHTTIIDASGSKRRPITVVAVDGTTIDGFTITGGKTSYGGGMYCYDSSLTLTNCTITGNQAYYDGGGIYCDDCSPTLTHCLISGNYAYEYGGGVCCSSASPNLTNCTIIGNSAYCNGNGFCCDWYGISSPTLTNCILWNPKDEMYIDEDSSITIQYSCVQGGYSGGGNNDFDPLFVDLPGGDYRLQDGSPCIDAGTDQGLAFNGNAPDMGYWESPADYRQGQPREPMIRYVNASAPAGGNGRSWATAFQEVSSAINWWAAAGDEIWVASGTYYESLVILEDNVALFGGFAGTETARDRRDWMVYPTILNASGLGSCVVAIEDIDGTIVDGFTMTGGAVTGSLSDYGGGLCYYRVDSATLAHCTITGNYTDWSGGGGVSCSYSSPTLINCTIMRNEATGRMYGGDGGGVACGYGSSPTLINCLITDNSASGYGGGLFCDRCSPTLFNCTIAGNSVSGYGSGIYCYDSSPRLMNCILFNKGNEITGYYTTFSLTYCCVQGGWPGEGNISGRPLFVDSENGDYRLQDGSPCIDRGQVSAAPDEDIEGSPRPGGDGFVDIGAHESPAEYEPGESERIIFRVRANAPASGDGRTWDTALDSIQAALSMSCASDEIWVASGTYYENIYLESDVSLHGGFAGFEMDREQRDWDANPTVLDASGKYASTVCANSIESATLDGFTITGGSGSQGGGIICDESSLTLTHCIITGNSAFRGGGVCIYNSCSTLTNCIIFKNSAYSGGGLYCSSDSPPRLTNCTITENSADYEGGGMYCYGSSPRLTNCTIVGNSANFGGGGVYCYYSSSPTLTNCILWNRGAELSGISSDDATLKHCCVQGGWPGEGNISTWPLFVNEDAGDYHLQNGSPCIDRGLVSIAPETDIEGRSRPGEDGLVDIGAYETQDDFEPGPAGRSPGIIYVNANASNDGDGSSWSMTLQSITKAFEISGTSDEIWVAAGRYNESVLLEQTVAMYGGFPAEGSPAFDDRDWAAYETIVDATGLKAIAVYGTDLCRLDGFTITGGFDGGVYCSGPSLALVNCTIYGNEGGSGSGVVCYESSSPILVNCAIVGNRSSWQGGGLTCASHSSPTLINCTIGGNEAVDGNGGVLMFDHSSPTLTNCILWNDGTELLDYDNNANITVRYCCIQDGWPGEGNISDDPRFADAANGDYRLLLDSPCIDVGSNNAAQEIHHDLDGNCRIWDGDGDGMIRVDMGAYEFDSILPLPGDTNGDASINHIDPFFFSRWWQGPRNETNFLCDVIRDATIDEQDLLELLECWK